MRAITFEEFKTIHQLLASHIRESEFANNVFYVGGCVRDMILNNPIKGIDICVQMPNGGIRLAEFLTKKLGIYQLGSNPISYPQFGTSCFRIRSAIPQLGDVVINLVQSSKFPYKGNESKKLEERFGTIQEDALTRDLTINALYMNMCNGETLAVLDTSGDDLRNRLIRAVSKPYTLFETNPLCILRAIRVASEIGGGIEAHTWGGMCANVYKLDSIPNKMFIRDEFNKMLVSDGASDGIRRLYLSGAMNQLIPEFEGLKGMKQGKEHIEDAFDHSLTVMSKMQPIVVNRLSGLLHDIGKITTRTFGFNADIHFYNHENEGAKTAEMILDWLGYDNETIRQVSLAISNHMRFKASSVPSNQTLRKFSSNMTSEDDFNLCLELIDADNTSHAPKYCKVGQVNKIKKRLQTIAEREAMSNVKLPINGKEIMEVLGIKKGPKVGAAIRLLEEYQMISPKMTKEEAIKILKRSVEKGDL